jgi:hypothetical protein
MTRREWKRRKPPGLFGLIALFRFAQIARLFHHEGAARPDEDRRRGQEKNQAPAQPEL